MSLLLKPYFTLDSVYNELKDFVSLDNVEDILLLAREKRIEVLLRCDRPITLVKAEVCVLVRNPYKTADVEDDDLVVTEHVRWALKKEATDATWVLSQEDEFICLDGSKENIFLRPVNCIPKGAPTTMRFEYADSLWMESYNPPIAGENLCAVEYNGDIYFVCKSMASNPFAVTSIDIDGQQRMLKYRLDTFLVRDLISNRKYVVKQDDLNAFIDSNRSVSEQTTALSWSDLFLPLERHSDVFESYKTGAMTFIDRENRLPTCKELWNEMVNRYGFDEQRKVILNISRTPIDWENFRSYFNQHVRKECKTRD